MSSEVTQAQYREQTHTQKLIAKAKSAPFVPIGIAAMLGMVGYGAYSYKNRGGMSTSIFLMHLRVKAQSMIVGAIAIGAGYTLFKDYIWDKEGHQKELDKANGKH
jgi:hypothetical protein